MAAAPLAAVNGRVFYINDQTGDDKNNGLSAFSGAAGAGPWRSLARLSSSGLAAGDAVELACGGIWRETLRLPASGTSSNPITVRGAPGGCTTLPTVDGSVDLPAAAWTRFQGSIYSASLATAPQQLFAASGIFSAAHHPNRGYLASDPTAPFAAVAANGNTVTVNGQQGSTTFSVGADLALPAGAAIAPGARVRIRTAAWELDELAVASVNGSQLGLAAATSYPVTAGMGYVLLGQLWMLDSPGEWFYDSTAGMLYAWMPDSNPPPTVGAGVLAVGIDLHGQQNIVIDGLAVRRAGTGIALRNSTNVRVRNALVQDIADVGADAVSSQGLTLESNAFQRTGSDAISGVDDVNPPATGMTVTNNMVRDSGVIMQGEVTLSVPRRSYAAIRPGPSATVSGNAIINAGYHGIWAMANSVVANNFVFGVCSVIDDCGGIYIFTDHDITISGNTVLHARGVAAGKPAGQNYTQAQGIYLDEYTIRTTIQNNTVIDTDNGVQVHSSAMNTLQGNRFFGNRSSQIWMQEQGNRYNPNGDLYGNTVLNNQLAPVTAGSVALRLDTIFTSTAAFATFDGNRYYDRASSVVAYASTAQGAQAFSLSQWQQSSGVGSATAVDRNGSSVSAKGYSNYAVAGPNIVPNNALANNAAGWATWNQTLPAGQLFREACPAGTCLRYVAGGSAGLVSSPNFSVLQGQWYRLAVDLSTQTDAQPVQLIVRRGGGGTNGYESLSDRVLTVTAGKTWGRYAVVFQATETIIAGNPVTGDNGARVDVDGIIAGQSVSFANMELVPVSLSSVAQTAGAMINAGSATTAATCAYASTQPALCAAFRNLANDQALTWPYSLAPYSAMLLYAQDPALVDSDGDGIPDSQDACPGTPPGAVVNAAGCSWGQH